MISNVHLLCASHCFKCLAYINLESVQQTAYIIILIAEGKTGAQKLHNLPKVTDLVGGRAKI